MKATKFNCREITNPELLVFLFWKLTEPMVLLSGVLKVN